MLDLLSFDTQNPFGETASLGDNIERYLANLGLETKQVTVDPAKPNVLATSRRVR